MKKPELDDLRREVADTARRLDLPVDREVYASAGVSPWEAIVCAGTLEAAVCIVGRDLGRDEVRHRQPLVGASGRAVRLGLLRAAGQAPAEDDPRLEAALSHALLCNLVPYKPLGNRAFSEEVREAFRPFLERLLVRHWKGQAVLTLGNEATGWFERYAIEAPKKLSGHERYRSEVVCEITDGAKSRRLTVCPLPHPSPANATWRKHFPGLLAERLAKWR